MWVGGRGATGCRDMSGLSPAAGGSAQTGHRAGGRPGWRPRLRTAGPLRTGRRAAARRRAGRSGDTTEGHSRPGGAVGSGRSEGAQQWSPGAFRLQRQGSGRNVGAAEGAHVGRKAAKDERGGGVGPAPPRTSRLLSAHLLPSVGWPNPTGVAPAESRNSAPPAIARTIRANLGLPGPAGDLRAPCPAPTCPAPTRPAPTRPDPPRPQPARSPTRPAPDLTRRDPRHRLPCPAGGVSPRPARAHGLASRGPGG